MKTKKLLLAFLQTILFSAVIAQSPNKAKLDQFFDRLNEKNKAMGSLLITKDGQEVYSRMIGYSQVNGAEKRPLTAATRYRIGSITKMFTTALIFQLVEEKKLSLDDKLGKFFPQIPKADKITILHLLAHRSGVHDLADGSGRSNPRTQNDIIATLVKGGSDFEPGTKYVYSNSGFVVLGYIVEKLRGKPYAAVLQERITSKLSLGDTYSGSGLVGAAKNECYSYRYAGNWVQETETHLGILTGAGSIISTPADLIKFISSLFDGKLISKNNLALMQQQSLGMETFIYNGKTFYGHGGGIDNFGSWLAYRPDERLALAYTANAKVYPVTDIINGVFDIYVNKPFNIPSFESLAISTELLDKYVGIYVMDGAPKFTVSREGGTLLVQMADRPANALEAISENEFKIPNAPIEIKFDTANKKMILKRAGGERVFTKEN
jgi:D-alanyl-D-alanine carboxypeptidase